jgi:transcriptional regulator with XRE-family HTH domain
MKSISEALLDAIERSGMSVRDLEAASGVSRAALSRFRNGKQGLTLASLDALARVLGLELVEQRRRSAGRSNR